MKGLLVTVGLFGLCFGMPSNVEVMPRSGGLPPVKSGIPSGNNVEAMPTNAGSSMTRPSWPGSYQPYGDQYPSSGQTFQPYSSSSGGCSSGGCSSGGSSSYPSMNTYPSINTYPSYPSSGQSYPSYPSGGCSSGGCSSGSSYPASQPVYGGSSSYNPGWSTGGSSGFNPGVSTGGSSGFNPGFSGGSFSTLPGHISNTGMPAHGYNRGGSSPYPAPQPCLGVGVGVGCSDGFSSGFHGVSSYYETGVGGTMMQSMMPSYRNRRPRYSRRAGRFGGWGSKRQLTRPMPAMSSALPVISSGMPPVSSGLPSMSSGMSSTHSFSSSSSSGGCSSGGCSSGK